MVFVINVHPIRDRPIYPFPRISVNPLQLPVDPKSAIPARVFCTDPDQTITLPLSPKCKRFFRCLSYHIGDEFMVTVSLPPLPVTVTISTSVILPVTSTNCTLFGMCGHLSPPNFDMPESPGLTAHCKYQVVWWCRTTT